MQSDDGGRQSVAPATKDESHLLKTTQKYCACHTERLWTRHQTCWKVTSATPPTRRLKPPKLTTFARPWRPRANGCGRWRTVADGCERLRTVRNVERTYPQPPDPQSETGTLATHSGKTC